MSWGSDDEREMPARQSRQYGKSPHISSKRAVRVKPEVVRANERRIVTPIEKKIATPEPLTGKRESEAKVEKRTVLPWQRWRQTSPYIFKFNSNNPTNEVGNHFNWTKLYKNAYVNNSGDFGSVQALKNSQFNLRVNNEDLFSDYVDLDAAFNILYPLILPQSWKIPAGSRMKLLFRNALDGDIANTFEFYAGGYFSPEWREPRYQPHCYVVQKDIQNDGNEFKITISKDRHFVLEKIGMIIRDSNFQHCEEYLNDGTTSSGRGILDQAEVNFGAADEYTISLNVYTHNLHSSNQLINGVCGPMRWPNKLRVFVPRGTYLTGQINFPSQTSDIWLDLYFMGYFIFD